MNRRTFTKILAALPFMPKSLESRLSKAVEEHDWQPKLSDEEIIFQLAEFKAQFVTDKINKDFHYEGKLEWYRPADNHNRIVFAFVWVAPSPRYRVHETHVEYLPGYHVCNISMEIDHIFEQPVEAIEGELREYIGEELDEYPHSVLKDCNG